MVLSAKIYKGAEYRTKESFTYGRFDVRLRSVHREGMLTSFFTYNDEYPNTEWNEIDIEILGRYADDVQFNPITPGQLNHLSHYHTSFDPAAAFHEYGFEWTPQYVAWFVDGVEVHRQTGAHIAQLNLPQKIMMNIWNPVYAGWVGQWDENVLPAFAYYDWVRYSSFTPDSGTFGTGNNFTVRWKDEFMAWDTTRWQKATHTFNGNNCDFVQSNAVFKDGNLILCLTKQDAVGFTDNAGPVVKYGRAEQNGVLLRFTEELDPVSSQDPSKYINAIHPVTAATLLPDSQSVLLTMTGYHRDSVPNVIINGIRDRSAAQNSSGLKNVVLIKTAPVSLPVSVNCGGGAVGGFLPDQEWGPTTEYGYLDGFSGTNALTSTGPANAELFRSELNGAAEYRFRLPNGRYSVTLLMAENFFSQAGKRKFSVVVQGTVMFKDLDLFAVAGKSVQVSRSIQNVAVTNGELDIHFQAQIDNPIVNAIIVVAAPASVNDRFAPVPEQTVLGQNYPNPFNGRTVITVSTAVRDDLTLRIFDTLGRSIASIPLGPVEQGEYSVPWDANDSQGRTVGSGVYLYTVEGRGSRSTKKMLLVR